MERIKSQSTSSSENLNHGSSNCWFLKVPECWRGLRWTDPCYHAAYNMGLRHQPQRYRVGGYRRKSHRGPNWALPPCELLPSLFRLLFPDTHQFHQDECDFGRTHFAFLPASDNSPVQRLRSFVLFFFLFTRFPPKDHFQADCNLL